MLLIIALYACKGSGKTTVAAFIERLLRRDYGYSETITLLSFASLYKEIATLIGFDLKEKEEIHEEFGISLRDFLCSLGDFFREDLAVKTQRRWLHGSGAALSTWIMKKKLESLSGIVVIDDLRYVEEFEMLAGFRSVCVWVRRPLTVTDGGHASEKEFRRIHELNSYNPHSVLLNMNSLDDLYKMVDAWLKKVILKNLLE